MRFWHLLISFRLVHDVKYRKTCIERGAHWIVINIYTLRSNPLATLDYSEGRGSRHKRIWFRAVHFLAWRTVALSPNDSCEDRRQMLTVAGNNSREGEDPTTACFINYADLRLRHELFWHRLGIFVCLCDTIVSFRILTSTVYLHGSLSELTTRISSTGSNYCIAISPFPRLRFQNVTRYIQVILDEMRRRHAFYPFFPHSRPRVSCSADTQMLLVEEINLLPLQCLMLRRWPYSNSDIQDISSYIPKSHTFPLPRYKVQPCVAYMSSSWIHLG